MRRLPSFGYNLMIISVFTVIIALIFSELLIKIWIGVGIICFLVGLKLTTEEE